MTTMSQIGVMILFLKRVLMMSWIAQIHSPIVKVYSINCIVSMVCLFCKIMFFQIAYTILINPTYTFDQISLYKSSALSRLHCREGNPYPFCNTLSLTPQNQE